MQGVGRLSVGPLGPGSSRAMPARFSSAGKAESISSRAESAEEGKEDDFESDGQEGADEGRQNGSSGSDSKTIFDVGDHVEVEWMEIADDGLVPRF